MSTTTVAATPADGWLSVYTGPTAAPITIEKSTGTSAAHLAIDTAEPAIATGHHIGNGELKNVVLEEGENLYVRCIDGLSPTSENIVTITD
ncbi:hypothetical protein [Enterobacter hormaechei]|uniref:hypothetical protein n=1 Tax=Enterobacter hormaechei TaxID=158836 RepID=UPI0033603B06